MRCESRHDVRVNAGPWKRVQCELYVGHSGYHTVFERPGGEAGFESGFEWPATEPENQPDLEPGNYCGDVRTVAGWMKIPQHWLTDADVNFDPRPIVSYESLMTDDQIHEWCQQMAAEGQRWRTRENFRKFAEAVERLNRHPFKLEPWQERGLQAFAMTDDEHLRLGKEFLKCRSGLVGEAPPMESSWDGRVPSGQVWAVTFYTESGDEFDMRAYGGVSFVEANHARIKIDDDAMDMLEAGEDAMGEEL